MGTAQIPRKRGEVNIYSRNYLHPFKVTLLELRLFLTHDFLTVVLSDSKTPLPISQAKFSHSQESAQVHAHATHALYIPFLICI